MWGGGGSEGDFLWWWVSINFGGIGFCVFLGGGGRVFWMVVGV